MRPRITYANVISTLCLFLLLAGGTAYALEGSNTVFTDDIVNGEVKVADIGQGAVATDEIANNQVKAADLGDGEVKSPDIANGQVLGADIGGGEVRSGNVANDNLTGGDIAANSLKGADIDEGTLDIGPSSGDFVHGRGTLLSNRIVFLPALAKSLLEIPGLGVISAECSPQVAAVHWINTESSPVDVWIAPSEGADEAFVAPPGDGESFIATSDFSVAATISLGQGNDPGARKIAVIDVFAFQSADGAPCGFQAQGTLWTSE